MNEVVVSLIVLAILAGCGWALEHHGYTRGVEERDSFYEPILRHAAEAKIAADKRADAAEQAADNINQAMELEHAQTEQDLLARAQRAELRITALLRQRDAADASRHQQVPALPSSAPGGNGAVPVSDSDRRFVASISGVGERCEHDADLLARWQEWYSKQRASLATTEVSP